MTFVACDFLVAVMAPRRAETHAPNDSNARQATSELRRLYLNFGVQ
jgi:hypothetical protein